MFSDYPLHIALLALVVALLPALVALHLLVRRRKTQLAIVEPVLTIDLAALGTTGPPAEGPRLECYHVPVRLALLVVAPAGRVGELPPDSELGQLIDQITPGLSRVAAAHGTVIHRWPPQLSPRGFAQTFFVNVKLPGEHGRGSPWCAVAGKVEGHSHSLMAGLVLCAAGPNSLGQHVIERTGQWLDVLRVRGKEE